MIHRFRLEVIDADGVVVSCYCCSSIFRAISRVIISRCSFHRCIDARNRFSLSGLFDKIIWLGGSGSEVV